MTSGMFLVKVTVSGAVSNFRLLFRGSLCMGCGGSSATFIPPDQIKFTPSGKTLVENRNDNRTGYGQTHRSSETLRLRASELSKEGKPDEAEPLLKRMLRRNEKEEREVDEGLLMDLATVLKDQNKLGEAEPLLRRVVAAREATKEGFNHIDTHVSRSCAVSILI